MGTVNWYAWNDNTGATMDVRIMGGGGACSACINVADNGDPPFGTFITSVPNGTYTFEVNAFGCSACADASITTPASGDLTTRIYCT